jgi:uncharacterized membrane protein HdeD (DUF308 family)
LKKSNDDEKVELIKPKSKNHQSKEEEIKSSFNKNKKYISPILLGFVGLVFLTNSNEIIIYACYLLGAIIAGFGIYNIIKYTEIKNQLKIEDSEKLNTGIICIAIGLLVILLSSVIQTFLNIIIGIWLIATGITKLINISELYIVDKRTANLNIIEAFIVIAMGLYTIFFQNIVLTIVGIWMIIGAAIDLYNLLKK